MHSAKIKDLKGKVDWEIIIGSLYSDNDSEEWLWRW